MGGSKGAARADRNGDDDSGVDGRRLRSSRSHGDIVRAMHTLIGGGDMSPSAASVAQAAGVSMRTVFRHFEDMDTLYREVSAIVEAQVKPILQQSPKGDTWRERLGEMLVLRTEVFERIMPHRIAGSLRRFSSAYLMEDHRRFVRLERSTLLAVLPNVVTSNERLVQALEVATGFQTWQRLRQDQDLSIEESREVVAFTVDHLLAGV